MTTEPPTEPPGSPGEPGLDNLLVEHLPHVRAFLRLRLDQAFRTRESVSDLVQSVCREVLSHPERFEYQGNPAFRAWLCNAALNKLRDKRRLHLAGKRNLNREVGGTSQVANIVRESLAGPATQIVRAEDVGRVEAAFELLPETQREVLTLFKVAGLSHREIAEQLGISEANSRKTLTRALAAFAARWEELRGDDDDDDDDE